MQRHAVTAEIGSPLERILTASLEGREPGGGGLDRWGVLGLQAWSATCQSRGAKPGGFQTGGFPTFFGKGPDRVADPFGTVPRRCYS